MILLCLLIYQFRISTPQEEDVAEGQSAFLGLAELLRRTAGDRPPPAEPPDRQEAAGPPEGLYRSLVFGTGAAAPADPSGAAPAARSRTAPAPLFVHIDCSLFYPILYIQF